MIKAILFDLGNVIVPLDFERGYRAIAARCGCAPEEIPKRIGATDLVGRYESGRIATSEFVPELSALLGLQVDIEEFRRIWSAIFLPHTLVPEDLVAALKSRYRLVLLSNTNALHFEMIRENYPLLSHLDAFVLSYEVGAAKPSPVIYREAVARAGCEAAECFFTDDIPAFVEGARREGIDAERFEGIDKLERDLRSRGIVW